MLARWFTPFATTCI